MHELHRRVAGRPTSVAVDLVGLKQLDPLVPDRVPRPSRPTRRCTGSRRPSRPRPASSVRVIRAPVSSATRRHVHRSSSARGARRADAHVHAQLAPPTRSESPMLLRPSPRERSDLGERLVLNSVMVRTSASIWVGWNSSVSPFQTGTPAYLRAPPRLLAVAAVLDRVVDAAEHAGGVLHRLLVADLDPARPEVGHVGTLVVGGDLERGARPGRGLLEDDAMFLPFSRAARSRRTWPASGRGTGPAGSGSPRCVKSWRRREAAIPQVEAHERDPP